MATELDREQARELLAWYINGSLPQDQRVQVESWLARDAGLRAERLFMEQAAANLRETAQHPQASSVGRLLDRIAAEQAHAGANVVGMKQKTARMETGRKWMFAMAAAVILVQAIVIGALVTHGGDQGVLKPLSGPGQSLKANLQVTFVETAPEIEIRALLSEARAQIVSGPGSLGVYGLHVPADHLELAAHRLSAASAIVASVTKVDSP